MMAAGAEVVDDDFDEFLYFMAHIADRDIQEESRQEKSRQEKSNGAKMANDLATVRGLLALSPTTAIQELNSLRRGLNLPELLVPPAMRSF